jgi:hypothetical protein
LPHSRLHTEVADSTAPTAWQVHFYRPRRKAGAEILRKLYVVFDVVILELLDWASKPAASFHSICVIFFSFRLNQSAAHVKEWQLGVRQAELSAGAGLHPPLRYS